MTDNAQNPTPNDPKSDKHQKEGPRADGARQQGRRLKLADPEPWPDPVHGELLADEILAAFERFIAFPAGAGVAVTLWTLHAHAHEAFEVSPLLALTSPEKRCGKTTTLSLLSYLVPKPLFASNVSTAAIFRVVEAGRPTLLVDEADTYFPDRDDLRGILNSGHTRFGATVLRTVGDSFEPRAFSTWAPKAVALIGRFPSTLEDRSIVIRLRRRSPEEHTDRFSLRYVRDFEHLRRKAWRWSRDNLSALRDADPGYPSELNDRAADNWRPLLAIADRLGGRWPEMAAQSARVLSGAATEEDSAAGVQLLADLRKLFEHEDRRSSESIIGALILLEDRPWADWSRGRGLSKTQLARLLKPYGVTPRTIRVGNETLRGYLRLDLEDTFRRYLPEVQQPQQSNGDAANVCIADRNSSAPVSPWAGVSGPHESRPVAGVAPWEAHEREAEESDGG